MTTYFTQPLWLWLLVPVAVAATRILGRRIRQGIRFAPAAHVPATRTWRHHAAILAPLLYLAGLVLAVLALARPRATLASYRQETEAVAIQMIIDVSGTMNALDMSPPGETVTRLEVVKEAFTAFVANRPDDLIGLITFASHPITRIPLTLDHAVLTHVLAAVETPTAPEEQMTAIGDALMLAVARLEDAEPVTRLAVLLSDGVHNYGQVDPDFATEVARRKGVRVYTIGVGESGLTEYLLPLPGGRVRRGRTWIDFDGAELTGIAEATGGGYYHVTDADGLAQALAQIDELETTQVEHLVIHRYREDATRFILCAITLLALGSLLNTTLRGRCV